MRPFARRRQQPQQKKHDDDGSTSNSSDEMAPHGHNNRPLRQLFRRKSADKITVHDKEASLTIKSLSNGSGGKPKKRFLGNLLPSKRKETTSLQRFSASDSNLQASSSSQLQSPESNSTHPAGNVTSSTTNQQRRQDLFQWQDEMEEAAKRSVIQQKQLIKERDGFCRRVDKYDGQVIHVDKRASYELGQYLGGGVAGVVYEGHRLLPAEEYPVRVGNFLQGADDSSMQEEHDDNASLGSFLCLPSAADKTVANTSIGCHSLNTRDPSLLTVDSAISNSKTNATNASPAAKSTTNNSVSAEVALETTNDNVVIIDEVDAPSRSKHFTKAAADTSVCGESLIGGGMQETVAIKILNPVGFRTLSPSVTATAVVARVGARLESAVVDGSRPMEERHVWWLVNPSSRNLRTLQRYNSSEASRNVSVDRGSPEKGLRISLVAAYKDPKTNQLKELPLTRCIEIWGHVPFGASDAEFAQVMDAVDRVNQGLPPENVPAFIRFDEQNVPGRVATGGTTDASFDGSASAAGLSVENLTISGPSPMGAKRTGIYRAAYTDRKTVFCEELNAYIAIPAAPSKYLKWLRQRRAATKEIRNMMLIGRHRNVVHLFEVLELIQENKSTMFLILELVRGGELFDLISSNSAKISSNDTVPQGFTESETVMRKFFQELASGVHYCHSNGIAHRDLKPENLLVHNSRSGDCVLKIADFGLSAAFGPNSSMNRDQDTVVESMISGFPGTPSATRRSSESNLPAGSGSSTASASPIKQQMDRIMSVGGNALAFFTCGAVDDVAFCNPNSVEINGRPSPLKRMTSVVGSPHYVAPEIISQSDKRKKSKDKNGNAVTPSSVPLGYDGTKADVWSAGVILYAMLFRSLPFGEDLLRCPRFQSYRKWYSDVIRKGKNRRNNLRSALNPVITDSEEKDMLGPNWFFPSASSRESKDLIVYMLNPDPDMRPTIQLVLQHPWLLKEA